VGHVNGNTSEQKQVASWQSNLSLVMDESQKFDTSKRFEDMQKANFGRKAWMQTDRASNAWVTTCPKKHIRLNVKRFPVMAQIYIGVRHYCFEELVG
jgi:hypothetical protein